MHNDYFERLSTGIWAEQWVEFFQRGNAAVAQINDTISFLDKLLASKKCELVCDFDVQKQALQHPSLKHPSTYKDKLLKHYCTEHFRAQLLEKESSYFQGTHFPRCLHCDFEIKGGGNKRLNTKAVHIGLFHNEIIPIIENYFDKGGEQN